MTEIVFLFGADGAVGQEHVRTLAGQTRHRMVRINPRIHPFVTSKLGAGRPQFCSDDGRLRSKGGYEVQVMRNITPL